MLPLSLLSTVSSDIISMFVVCYVLFVSIYSSGSSVGALSCACVRVCVCAPFASRVRGACAMFSVLVCVLLSVRLPDLST